MPRWGFRTVKCRKLMENQGGDEIKSILKMAGGFTWENTSPSSWSSLKWELHMRNPLTGNKCQDLFSLLWFRSWVNFWKKSVPHKNQEWPLEAGISRKQPLRKSWILWWNMCLLLNNEHVNTKNKSLCRPRSNSLLLIVFTPSQNWPSKYISF